MKYNERNLEEVLEEHEKYIQTEGIEGSIADFSDASLTGVTFINFLRDADFRNATLYHCVFISTDLTNVNFRDAHIFECHFVSCIINNANFSYTYFSEAIFDNCGIGNTTFEKANLCDVIFSNICYSRSACFTGCRTERCKFINTDLATVIDPPYVPMNCPDTGSFIGWKKCKTARGTPVIVKLLIPEDAKRSSAGSRKCRCSKAIVQEIQTIKGNKSKATTAYSMYIRTNRFKYSVGETVVPEYDFDENRFNECASGIHFFINRQDAVNYGT